MDHNKDERLQDSELLPSILEAAIVYGAGGHKIGTIHHVRGPDAIIDVGGFLGIGAKPVAVPVSQLQFMRDDNAEIYALSDWTKTALQEMPEYIHHE